MLLVTQSAPLPELSESRYLCTSKIRLVVVLSGFVTVRSAAADPVEMKAPAEVYWVPGSRIIWVVAPAERIAVTAAWTEEAHVEIVTLSC